MKISQRRRLGDFAFARFGDRAAARYYSPMSQPQLPERFRDVAHLEDVMTTPPAALTAEMAALPGDLIVLGVGGKIGPTLARLAKRAAPSKRVVGVARFSEAGLREKLTGWDIECIE